MSKRVSVMALAAVCTLAVVGAPLAAEGPAIVTGKSVRHDTSPPLREIAIRPSQPPTGLSMEIPIRTRPGTEERVPVDGAPDPIRQDTFRPVPTGPTPAVSASFQGLAETDNQAIAGISVVPPDTNGDVGRDHNNEVRYLQWINLVWAVFDETGSIIPGGGPFTGNSFFAGFGGPCENTNDGDPIVHYDDNAKRWMVSQFAISSGNQCVAVSTSADPLGSYNRYQFTVTPGGNNDYPKMGVWDDGTTDSTGQSAYTFTTRDFGVAGFIGMGVMERDAMLNGAAAQFIKFQQPCTFADCREGSLPPHLDGKPVPAGTCPSYFTYFDAQFDDGPSAVDGVRRDELCVDWDNIASSTITEGPFIAGTAFDRGLGNGFSDCISPVQGGEPLDCLAIFTMHPAQVRNNDGTCSALVNTTVDVGGNQAGIRWGELRSSNCQTGWSFHQEGTYAPDNVDRWMGSMAMDGDGNIALGYSAASGSLFPSVRYTSRMAGDPLGTMPGGEESCHEGTGAQTASANRWGDYSRMSVDPEDDCTFWYTTEYYETTSSFNFKTRICSFKFDSCGDGGDPPIPCGDIRRFQARCRGGQVVQYRVIMTDTSNDGDTVTFLIDGANADTVTINNGRAQGRQFGFAAGPHTVTLSDPAGCFPDVTVNCVQ